MQSPHRHLAWLTFQRAEFRIDRAINRIKSPRRILASTIAVLFLGAYLLNGFLILSTRETADARSLGLWLSGGMVLYLIYHSVRCVWTDHQADLDYTEAEKLWLGGAPLRRSTLASYRVNSVLISATLKTFFLVIALAPDVQQVALLATGVFAALVLLETVRMTWQRFISGLSETHRKKMRVAVTLIATAAVVQTFGHLVSITPPGSDPGAYVLNSFRAIGNLAASDAVQWLAIPWRPAALLATTATITSHTAVQFFAAVALIPTVIIALVRIDGWAEASHLAEEKRQLASGKVSRFKKDLTAATSSDNEDSLAKKIESMMPASLRDSVALVWRQALSVRRYTGTIVFSFAIPTALCLSPLLTGRIGNQWTFIVAGVALCTMLLAPPALRIDFRRDLKRMLLLRSLPLRPIEAVLGQLTLPVLITFAFQWTTLGIAAAIVHPGWMHLALWLGMLSALAVFTFAVENALFLAYPHHENAQGFAMVVRANIMFLGKASVIAFSFIGLVVWVGVCKSMFGSAWVMPVYVSVAVGATWTTAALALAVTAWCWNRFDISADLPPE